MNRPDLSDQLKYEDVLFEGSEDLTVLAWRGPSSLSSNSPLAVEDLSHFSFAIEGEEDLTTRFLSARLEHQPEGRSGLAGEADPVADPMADDPEDSGLIANERH